jgi:hypothetical protein
MRQGRPPRPLHQQITDPAVEAVLVSVGILPWDNPDGPNQTVSLLLTSREHKAVNRNYFNAKIWKPALVAAGVPPTRENGCHALRHFYASVLLDAGSPSRRSATGWVTPIRRSRSVPTPTSCPTAAAHQVDHRRFTPMQSAHNDHSPECHESATTAQMMFISAAQRLLSLTPTASSFERLAAS